jgi:hypothetical protein
MPTSQGPGKESTIIKSHAELYALNREQQVSMMIVRVILVLLVIAILWIWLGTRKSPLDRSMGIQATEIEKAIQRYYSEELDYPDNLDDVSTYLSVTDIWPREPYNGEIIRDTGSPEFDPATSVGMVHYEHFESNDKSGYKLILFGRKGILETRYGGHVEQR